ncbi:MAG: peptidase [Candidatus Schekmanbacteria bacterium RBG_16_38_11]|uniref:Protease HtpX homolog n=1 Tax=Candidatus Schekmanbacteria bacterium RBG_16_38_11 TaxID=1817880 RepID=A0A1F7S003_9BACT|nr:MAG: peptidase [Candidatus Schekmanbacteria bacterium RBG_16_38_11]
MWYLKFRMYLLMIVLFAIVYAIVTVAGVTLGITNFYFYLMFSLGMMLVQYLIGPKIVEWSMKVKYIEKGQYPRLDRMVEELAVAANIPKPKIGISDVQLPNAFAFGRGVRDGRICVTQGILGLLSDGEMKAVLGHEMSHLKNRDVLFITILSVIPMLLYRLAWNFMFFGGGRDRDDRGGNAAIIGIAAFLFYFITNLLVLYASRIREYFADRGSVQLGNQPSELASALYKLVYGSAKMPKEALKEVEGLKAFFVNDPSQALNELRELKEVDRDRSGTIDSGELEVLRNKSLRLGFSDRLMEMLSTHPNMLKRIKELSEIDRRF